MNTGLDDPVEGGGGGGEETGELIMNICFPGKQVGPGA